MSRVTNLAEEIYREQQRRSMSGSFGYGDFGIRKNENLASANADKIIDEANMSWTDQQINDAKAKWREMVLNLQNAVKARNDLIVAIKQMPESSEKTIAIGEFNEADGIFMQAYTQAQPIFAKVGSLTGDNFPAAESASFGAAPLVWATVLLSLAAVTYISTSMYEARQKYEAIKVNPAVAQYLPSGGFTSLLGDGLQNKLLIGGLAVVAFMMLSRKTA